MRAGGGKLLYEDPDVSAGCLGQTGRTSNASVQSGYDRGHLVTSDHMDYDATYIRRANYMTNVVPQLSSFDPGIWVGAENVAQCYRDIAPVDVHDGVVYGDACNDHFLASHDIPPPAFFWKTIITKDPSTGTAKAISWIIPNETGLGSLDSYLVTVADLEELPSGCDLS